MPIPASDVVSIVPGVLSAGAAAVTLSGLLLSKSAYLPISAVQSFASADAVSAYFGSASAEYSAAQNYFLGFDNSTIKPGALLIAPYIDTARAAWLQSGSLSGLTLAQLQALSGVLTVTVNGSAKTSSAISLAGATSFSNAATIILAGFTTPGFTVAWDAVKSAFIFTNSTTGATSTLTEATGTLSAGLKLSTATGAVLSQGAAVDTPAGAMDMVKGKTTMWASFATMWEPSGSDETAFAVWCNAQNQRYLYVAWDTDANAIVSGNTTNFGYLAKAAAYDAVLPLYAPSVNYAAFILGAIASIDFSQTNGRATLAYKSQSGLVTTVSDQQTAANLIANGYSYYGAYATAADNFNFLYNGQITGKWKWADTYVNQIRLNSDLQAALLSLLTSVKSVPYTNAGYDLIRSAMMDPVRSALNFGTIRAGVALSISQAAQVNQAAGRDVATEISQRGFYLQVMDPGATVRQNRGTPVINFWYADGGAVQKINLPSIAMM